MARSAFLVKRLACSLAPMRQLCDSSTRRHPVGGAGRPGRDCVARLAFAPFVSNQSQSPRLCFTVASRTPTGPSREAMPRSDPFVVAPLRPEQIDQAFALVHLLHPTWTLEAWRR